MADIACVALPLFLCELVAGQNSVLAVDDNHMVAAVYIGSKGGLVLASEQHGSLSGNSAEGLACCVNYIPAAFNFGLFLLKMLTFLFLLFIVSCFMIIIHFLALVNTFLKIFNLAW